ncbi:molybdopterin molybdotransferase MoeA [Thauera sinica]|uniref:Molybdopterin molybdenumtransferase n=1 Tax=Thauera sinica TaxID=2665146 RepID=A0ABW1ALM9_9RHOO|nr:gephyrin-like molybdotransferase Glp [Thauera sp. K11]ATE60866.1 molybdopterin molybdenumtransferase MoeA [Thauera sp. K11]
MPKQNPAADTRDLLSVADARRMILDSVSAVVGREYVTVRAALGRVLAADVVAPCNVPSHDNSAMDGYAMRTADLAAGDDTVLPVAGTAFAGRPFAGAVGPGQAIRIMTGAPIPQGADTVVMQEAVRRDGGRIVVPPGQETGQNVRRAGEDLVQGTVAVAAGTRCGPAQLGLIASLGIAEVAVRRRLRVAFFSTGDEIAPIGRPLAPGEVYDSNRYTLFGALSRLGCDLLDMGVVADDPASLEGALRDASLAADVIVTSGGVSVGEADFVRDLMSRMGEVAFWTLAIKPGKPMAFGRIGDAVLFGLPGNPVAVLVTFYQVVQDALLQMMGVSPLPAAQRFHVPCEMAIRRQPGRREFVRGRLLRDGGRLAVTLAGAQGSGVLRSMSEADCFIVLPEDCAGVRPGDAVLVEPFAGLV